MRIVFVVVLAVIAMSSSAQHKIALEKVIEHIGDSVELKVKISEVVPSKKKKNSPTIINVGGKSPKQLLSIIINDDVRKKLGYNLDEEKYLQGMLTVTGKLERNKGKLQLTIKNPKQLLFLYDEEVSASEIPPIEKKGN